jgi:glycosyltransferase involved in cell wall biosynthesis
MSNFEPKFSVLMTSFNYERFIGDAIESILAQTNPSWELIIVDDCSQDNSWVVISRYVDPRIRAIRFEKNRGACHAYNMAFSLAKGKYIASIDSDDLFHPEKLEEQSKLLDFNLEIDICGCYLTEINDVGEIVPTEKQGIAAWFNRSLDLNNPASWVWRNHLCHSGVVIRKSFHEKIGLFRADLTYTPDWNFWIRSLAAGARFEVIPQELVRYRSHESNITHRRPQVAMMEYAEFSKSTFHPYLEKTGRSDLIAENIAEFFRRFFAIGGKIDGLPRLVATLGIEKERDEGFVIPQGTLERGDIYKLTCELILRLKDFGASDSTNSDLSNAVDRLEIEREGLIRRIESMGIAESTQAIVIGKLEMERTNLIRKLGLLEEEVHSGFLERTRFNATLWGRLDRGSQMCMRQLRRITSAAQRFTR